MIFRDVINQRAGIVEKRVKKKVLPPWMDTSIICCIQVRNEFTKLKEQKEVQEAGGQSGS